MLFLILFILVPTTILSAFFASMAYDEGKRDCRWSQIYRDSSRSEYENKYIIPFAYMYDLGWSRQENNMTAANKNKKRFNRE